MFKVGIFCILLVGVNAVSNTFNEIRTDGRGSVSSRSSASESVGAGPGVGGRVGGGIGAGAGAFAGSGASAGGGGNNGFGYQGGFDYQPFVPNFLPHINSAEYQRAFNEYLDDSNNYHTRAYTSTYASPNAQAYATASMVPNNNNIQDQIAQHQAYILAQQAQAQAQHEAFTAQLQAQIAQNMAFAQGGIPVYGGATAAVGPHGGHQTAFVIPQNPAFPNVDTRFDGTDNAGGGRPGGGFYGVSTSSFSTSSDVNGQKQQGGHSVTTINDNGKVTTFETRP